MPLPLRTSPATKEASEFEANQLPDSKQGNISAASSSCKINRKKMQRLQSKHNIIGFVKCNEA